LGAGTTASFPWWVLLCFVVFGRVMCEKSPPQHKKEEKNPDKL